MLPTQELGTTGLSVSRIGLGMAALGRPGYINLGHGRDIANHEVQAMAAQAAATLDAAWDGGVRYFDAARSYGRGEEFLANWLRARGLTPADCVIGSKWGYTYTAGWQVAAEQHEVKDHSLATFQRQLGETRNLLDGFLRVYMVHSATLDSGLLERADLLDAIGDARARGAFHAAGLSLSGVSSGETLRRAREVVCDGRRLFDVVQATWNPLEPSLAPLLTECRQQGMAILVKEALANGRLTSRNDDPLFRVQRAMLETEAARIGATIDQLVLAYALEQPWADCVLSGAATPAQLQSNLGAIAFALDDTTREHLADLAEPVVEYYQKRASLAWN